jgi:hypothetical protein
MTQDNGEIEVLEDQSEQANSGPAFTPTQDAMRLIGEWLAAYARGQTKDQNTVLLDRILREKVQAAKQPRRPVNVEGELKAWIDRYVQGVLPDSTLKAALDSAVQQKAAAMAALMAPPSLPPARMEAHRTATSESYQDNSGDVRMLGERIAELEVKCDALQKECDRAHDWRFHLESRAREVYRSVRHLLEVAKRAPSKDEMAGIVETLKEAIGWSP